MWQIWLIAAVLPLIFIWNRWVKGYVVLMKRLHHFPGPKPLPVIGNLLDVGLEFSKFLERILGLWRIHGNAMVLWLGPEPIVVLSEARDAEIVLSDIKHIDKGFPYSFLEPWLGTGLLTSTGEKWHKHRKLITPTFHFKILEQFTDIFSKQGDILISRLQEKVHKESFDIIPYIDLYTHDVICESAMGVNLKSQSKDKRSTNYLSAVQRQMEYIVQRSFTPWLHSNIIFGLSLLGRKQAKSLAVLHKTTNDVISKRQAVIKDERNKVDKGLIDDLGIKKRFAFLDLLLITSNEGKVLSNTDIREEVDTFMFEGHDTTSSAICFTLFELSRNPDVQEKAFKELEEVMGDELTLTVDKINKLKYLECVVKEGLRLYPSVPLFTRKLKEDIHLKTKNLTIPSGSTVAVPPFVVHRNPEFFPDPEKFNPDHFLPERAQGRHAYAYVPFSAGPRNCIGQKFAMLEMKSVISKIIWNFQIQPEPGFEPHLVLFLTLNSDKGLFMKLVPRCKDK